jgi:hypothetical protein
VVVSIPDRDFRSLRLEVLGAAAIDKEVSIPDRDFRSLRPVPHCTKDGYWVRPCRFNP